ncbi:histidine kinase dimerization/phosphoacceptor domain -containing protein [Algibacter sp. 2305UL17-15]|uniref:sensor histidine kinase n=1 Tax=Algibacter sp. 2305UL17-15 TaxID=3231268 RepID=UPI003457B397
MFFLMLFASCSNNTKSNVQVSKNNYDLTHYNFGASKYVFTDSIAFYWKQFPFDETEQFNTLQLQNPEYLPFSSCSWKELNYPAKGYGTYRFHITLPDTINQYAISTLRVKTSSEIWVNGTKIKELGKPSKLQTEAKPSAYPLYVNLPKEKELDIIIPISNYHHNRGGDFTTAFVIGLSDKIFGKQLKKSIVEASLTVVVLIIGLLQLLFFVLKEDKIYLYLFLASFFGAFRQVFVDEVVILNFFPELSYDFIQRTRYITYFVAIVFLTFYLRKLFKENLSDWIAKLIIICFSIGTALVCVLPIFRTTQIAVFFQIMTIVFLIYLIILAVKLYVNKSPYRKYLIFNVILVSLLIINDVLFANGIIRTMFLSNYTILLFVSIQAIYNYKSQVETESANKYMNFQVQQKELMVKEIHHRVKNNFQIVSSLLELQTKGIEDEKALKLAKESKNRVKSMALIHQRLYQNDDLLIEFNTYVKSLVRDISSMYGKDKNPKVTITIPDCKFDIDTAIPLGLIVNELITNAYKYGFGLKEQTLDISVKKTTNGNHILKIKDNGVGLPTDFNFEKAKSLGLRLVRRLSKQLHGTTTYTYNNGALFSVEFKDTNARAAIA